MAYLLKYRYNREIISPANGLTFSGDEVKQLIKADDYTVQHVLTINGKFSQYKIAFDPSKLGNESLFNMQGTRAILRGTINDSLYTFMSIKMRLGVKEFVNKYPECSILGGFALVGTFQEIK